MAETNLGLAMEMAVGLSAVPAVIGAGLVGAALGRSFLETGDAAAQAVDPIVRGAGRLGDEHAPAVATTAAGLRCVASKLGEVLFSRN